MALLSVILAHVVIRCNIGSFAIAVDTVFMIPEWLLEATA